MTLDNAVNYLVALLVILVVALQVQIIKINKRLKELGDQAAKK